MKHVLIITEDVVKIQLLSGFLGRLFSWFYLRWLKLRLLATLVLFKPFARVSVITSDAFNLKKNVYSYGDQLAKLDYSVDRARYLKITDRLLKNVEPNLFRTRLAIYLTYHYFIYTRVYEEVISRLKPDFVVTLSSSYHEQTARFIAGQLKIKSIRLHWLTFVWLNRWLTQFFLRREYQKKINQFMSRAKIKPPDSKKLKRASLLSLDFYRHLKTLAPVYKTFAAHGRNPWFVSDIANTNSTLNNFRLGFGNRVYLASFLPAGIKLAFVFSPQKLSKVNDLNDFLYNLGLTAAAPMIEYGQILTRLYLAAAKELFKIAKPQNVITVSDLRFGELALSRCARETKTRSVLVSPNTIFALDKINAYDTTDVVAVAGEFVKRQLVDQGMKGNKIHVIGDPQTENYRQLKFDKTKVYKELKIEPTKKIVLLISFGATWMIPKPEKEAFFKMASRAVEANPDSILVIKPHPTEKRYRLMEELKKWRINRAIVSDNNRLELVDLLDVCSVVVQTWSMTIFEAIMMKRPVISVSPFKKNYGFFLPILKVGGAIEAKNQVELNHWLKILLDFNHPQTRRQLTRAGQACVDFIKPASYLEVTDRILDLASGRKK